LHLYKRSFLLYAFPTIPFGILNYKFAFPQGCL
jgi:hypothetical protein